MRSQRTAPIIALAALLACGGGASAPTEPVLDLGGRYAAEHAFVINGSELRCTGGLFLSTSGETTFGGSLRVDPCPFLDDVIEAPIQGTASASGAVSFTFLGGLGVGDVLREGGCTVTSADPSFAGTFSNGRLEVEASASASDCPDVAGPVQFTWRIEATRTG